MKVLNFIVGSFVGAVALFLMGWLIYGILLMDTEFMAMDTDMGWREMPDLVAIFVGEWMVTMLLTLIIGYWSSLYTFAGGAKAGALLGLFLGLGFGFLIYAQRTDIAMEFIAIDTFINIIRLAIAGGLIALVVGKMTPRVSPSPPEV